MSRFKHVGDFIFGVVLLSATPIFIFIGTAFVVAILSRFDGYGLVDYLGQWVILGISFTSYLLACVWRKKHRRIPMSVFPIEVVVSIITGVGFMLALSLVLYVMRGTY